MSARLAPPVQQLGAQHASPNQVQSTTPLVVDLPIAPRTITSITAAVRYGRAGPGTLVGWYGVISIPGLDGVIPLGPHATEAQADKELRARLALMREQLTGQGVESEGFEIE